MCLMQAGTKLHAKLHDTMERWFGADWVTSLCTVTAKHMGNSWQMWKNVYNLLRSSQEANASCQVGEVSWGCMFSNSKQ
jgi:hypothetical protein